MVSTYSTSLRLELMATGDQSGTWGDTTNTNLGGLIEQAITGYEAITHDNSENYELTFLDGALDQARNMVLNIGGTLTIARNVVAPAVPKIYLVRNSTSGGFNITIKTPSGDGVEIRPGGVTLVYCDGTDFVRGIATSDIIEVGDFFSTARTLDDTWLRRNGALYDSSEYPELAAVLPALPDGITWTNITVGQTGLQTIFSAPPGGFLIGRSYSVSGVFSSDIYRSTDGDSWAIVETLDAGFAIADFTYGASVYMAADNNGTIATSNDAISWSVISSVVGGTSPFLTSIAFGNSLFVMCAGNAAGRYILSSPDGVTWTQRHSGISGVINYVNYLNGMFVVVGQDGVIITSPDGLTWTTRTSGTAEDLNDVTYGNSLYTAVGDAGVILTSPDLASWTPRTSGTALNLNAVLYSTSGFLAVGASGVARISSNGTSWAASVTGTSLALLSAVFDPDEENRYLVVQSGSTAILQGIRTLPTQFQVPNDDPQYGWIKATGA